MKAWKKLLGAGMFAAMLTFAAVPSAAEATVIGVQGHERWRVDINDSSVYMVGQNHAHVVIAIRYDRYWTKAFPVDVAWGKGFSCARIDDYGNVGDQINYEVGLAVANYMSENY